MLTAGITAAIGGVLALFGIKPGGYLVVVAIVVKVTIVGVSALFIGNRYMKRRREALPTSTPPPPSEPPNSPS